MGSPNGRDTGGTRQFVTRRQLLSTVVGAGTPGVIAGCTGAGDGTGQDPLGRGGDQTAPAGLADEYEGATLTWFLRPGWMGREPNARWATWFATGAYPGTGYTPVGDRRFSRPGAAWDATMARGIWGAWINEAIRTGEPRYGLYEDVAITADEMVVQLRSDATWSDGTPVGGRDVVPLTMAARLSANRSFAAVERKGPSQPVEAITAVEWDDTSARFISQGDWFDAFLPQELWGLVARKQPSRRGDGGVGGVMQPTRMRPYESWFERLQEFWAEAKAGTIDPREGESNLWRALTDALPEPPEESWYAYFSKPENCVVTGAFQPVQIDPVAIVLEANPEFYAAEDVEIDHVIFPLHQNMDAHWGALLSNQRDYLRYDAIPEAVDGAPDRIDRQVVPAPSGWALAMNQQTPPFDDRRVRQAIYYALDTETIAENLNPNGFRAVTVPGGHGFRTDELLDGSFVEETLHAYPADRDRAAERMRAAGYERDDGQWIDEDGAAVTIPIMSSGRDLVAITVRHQLSTFGLEPEPLEMNVTADGQRPAAWAVRQGTGFALEAVGGFYEWVVGTASRAREFGVFPMDQIERVDYGDREAFARSIDAFVLDAPPVGDPEGPMRSWEAPRLARECVRAETRAEYVALLETLAWIYNWQLPVLPLVNGYSQHFMNVDAWEWPDLGAPANDGVGVAQLQPEDLLALGEVGVKE